jgi:hypothetical protein
MSLKFSFGAHSNFMMQSSLSSVLPPEEKLLSPAPAGDAPFFSLPRRLVV